jgi:hypothetical protein
MRRREFFTLLGCAAVGWPIAGHGQASKIYRLGYLSTARVPNLIFDPHLPEQCLRSRQEARAQFRRSGCANLDQ